MTTGPGLVDRSLAWARSHPELVMFGVGLLLFTGGLVSVMTGFFSPEDDPAVPTSPQVATASPSMRLVGPPPGAEVGAYIAGREQALRTVGSKDPRSLSFAVVSFDGYRKVGDVDRFFKARKLPVETLYLRIPLPGFDPETVRVSGTLADAVGPLVGRPRVDALREEAAALEAILPETQDAAYRSLYEKDLADLRKAIDLLQADPSVVYGAVVKTTNANLVKLMDAEGVRLVDLSDDPGASPSTHEFRPLLPEQTDRT